MSPTLKPNDIAAAAAASASLDSLDRMKGGKKSIPKLVFGCQRGRILTQKSLFPQQSRNEDEGLMTLTWWGPKAVKETILGC